MNINVDFSAVTGPIKPIHGVGQPPFNGMDFSTFRYLTDAGIPFSRLHDLGVLLGGRFVDIPLVFRDFGADPADPASYDFAFTDPLITALVESGAEPFFRLGVTIENFRQIKAYHIYPPADNLQWARICEGVIRHYTEGWADGFHYHIRYWEIWNEPDNFEDPYENQMWRGTMEQYFDLYKVSSKYLKEKFPHLMIGGYASCGFYALTRTDPAGKHYDTYQYYMRYFDAFLKMVKEEGCPLDFFSWHSYGSIEETVTFAAYARQKLDEAGFQDTEHTCNEWNVKAETRGTPFHAAQTAGMLLALQNTSLDSAMFYDARIGPSIYGGLFNPMNKEPLPAYYGFMAFNELYRRKNQVAVTCDAPGVYAAGAKGEDRCLVMVNTNPEAVPLSLNIDPAEIKSCRLTDGARTWEETPLPAALPAESFICLILQ